MIIQKYNSKWLEEEEQDEVLTKYDLFFPHAGKDYHSAIGRIALVMCLACASAGTVQCGISEIMHRLIKDSKFNINEIANVILGALVAVTGCCPFIEPWFAVLIGGVSPRQ